MNYPEMSDFDINCAVAKSLGLKDFGIGLFSDEIRVHQVGELAGDKFPFDPCKSWADAGPIIENNDISIIKLATKWMAITSGSGIESYLGEDDSPCLYGEGFEFKHKNPLRAAMIVFLMMKDEEAKNESH